MTDFADKSNGQLRRLFMQARSQGGFEGVRTNPPCNLVKLKFYLLNAQTAAVQLQSFNRAVVVLHHAAATL